MELCFRFVMITILITREVLFTAKQHKHSIKTFTGSHPSPPTNALGVHNKLEGDRARTADPRDNLDHTASCSAWKAVEKEQGIFRVMALVFPSHHCT